MYWLRHEFSKLNWYTIGNVVGMVLLAVGSLMGLPLLCGLIYHESISAFLWVMLGCFILGFLLARIKVEHSMYFARDGLMAVALCWLVVAFIGALPFYISQTIPSFVDALFESVSGFTTTGSSILTEVEPLPKCMLFWRSFSHWIGGMGILVFVLAILPKSNDRSMHILRAESPGPVIGKLVPRLQKSSLILYSMYMGLTVIEIVLLLAGNMPLFDALCNTFGTAGTGGFGVTNQGIGQYGSPYYEMVIGVFMALFGVNFNFYFLMLIREFKSAFSMEEVRDYFLILGASVLMIAINIMPLNQGSLIQSLRYAFFQVSSIMTTTGYSSCNFDMWPTFSKLILLFLMVVGACAGSTGGGMKVSRIAILIKKIYLDISRSNHPKKVQVIRYEGKIVDDRIVDRIMSFFASYILILVLIMLIVSTDGFNLETTISACVACISNIGPGFSVVGPFGNFHAFSDLSKIALSLAMLVGRLEIYPMLIFIAPLIGKHRKKKRSTDDIYGLDNNRI